jgi:hypothetical protein
MIAITIGGTPDDTIVWGIIYIELTLLFCDATKHSSYNNSIYVLNDILPNYSLISEGRKQNNK